MAEINLIANRDQAVAFSPFLASEQARHLEDVKQICLDLAALSEKWNIEIPPVKKQRWEVE